MSPRLKLIKCSDESWQELLVAMNRTQDEVEVSAHGLDDTLRCHEHYAGEEAKSVKGMVTKLGRKKCTVVRKSLFQFVQEHGSVCGKG
jgi:hypothetical protein